ncbi:MAG: PD-(D/E)XK nuclease family protein [Candidatus Anammoxibacter sp.]
MCQHKYKLHYVDLWRPRLTKAIFEFGHACHKTVTDFLVQGTDPAQTFADEWLKRKDMELDYSKIDSYDKLRDIGLSLAPHIANDLSGIDKVSDVEQVFRVPFENEHELHGYLDFTGEIDGIRTIVDIKTSRSFDELVAAMSTQLTFYSLATGIPDVAIISILKQKRNPSVNILKATRNPERIDEFKEQITETIRAIRS